MDLRFSQEKRTDRIEIRIEPTLKELFADLAFGEGVKVSDYVRTLMIEELERKTGRWKHQKN
jgi:hypothetical protein